MNTTDRTTRVSTATLGALGRAALSPDAFANLVRDITGRPDATPASVRIEPVDYTIGTPTTEQLLRLHGTARTAAGDTIGWSCFVKRLRSAKWWPDLHLLPPEVREIFVAELPWRLELAVHTSRLASILPDGLRLPTLYRLEEYADQRATLWMENVVPAPGGWDLDRFHRAAYRLGRLAARRQPHLVEPILPRPGVDQPGSVLRYYVDARIRLGILPVLADDETWKHPLLQQAAASTGDHHVRADLAALAERLPGVLDALDALPQTYQHGDASPQNLLVPAAAPDDFVAIDWGFDCPQAVGFDLGQLLVGLAHADELDPDELPAIDPVIVQAYWQGLDADGLTVPVEQVRYGYLGSLLARAAFTALPLELLGAEPSGGAAALFGRRLRLTRTIVNLVSPVL